MYLVELRPGKEELYRSGDELAAAIRRGDVDVHSRIYHRATSKWISVTLHPQYKAIVAEKAAEPLPPLDRSNWTYLTSQSDALGVPDAPSGAAGSGEAPSAGRPQAWRRLFGLGVAGVALVLGVQIAFSGPRPPWAEGAAPAPQEHRAQAGPPAVHSQVVSLASTSAGFERVEPMYEPDAPEVEEPAKQPAPELPRAPKLRLKTLKEVLPESKAAREADAQTVEGFLARYSAAHQAARERLGSGVRVARLQQLFAPSRLTPNGGVTETRLGLAGVANFIRVYRQQESLIEREYQDTFAVVSRDQEWPSGAIRQWYGREPHKEPAALADLASRLVASLDTLLGVLDNQAGAYRLGDGTIAFEDADASRRYSSLRRQIVDLIHTARAAGGEESPGPMGHLLRAVGTTRLPLEI